MSTMVLIFTSILLTMPLPGASHQHRACDYLPMGFGGCTTPPETTTPADELNYKDYKPHGRLQGFVPGPSTPPKGASGEESKASKRRRLLEVEQEIQTMEFSLTQWRKMLTEQEARYKKLVQEREQLEGSIPAHLAPTAPGAQGGR